MYSHCFQEGVVEGVHRGVVKEAPSSVYTHEEQLSGVKYKASVGPTNKATCLLVSFTIFKIFEQNLKIAPL